MAQITSSVTFIPSAYDGGTFTTNTTYPTSNGLSDTSSTSYARFTVSTTSQYAIYNFDTSDIPSNATINSITCQAKISYSGSNITTKTIQLYAGSTAKGSAATINVSGTSNVTLTNITTGTWTAQELQNAKLRITGQRSGNQSRYILFYGATLTVNYTYTLYDITATSDSTGVTVSPSSQGVVVGDDAVVILNNVSDPSTIIVKDNGSDVTSQLVHQVGGSQTLNPSSYNSEISNPYTGSTGYTNGCTSTDSTTFATLRGRNSNNYYYFYDFDSFDIPKIAAITKVTLKIKACRYSSYTWDAVLCDGTNEVSNVSITAETSQSTTPASSDPSIFTIENTTLTDVSNLKIKLKQTSGSNNSRFFFYGADLTITYTVPEGTYTYTISNVQADHVVTVEDVSSGVSSFVKKNSQYKQVNSVYKKNGNVWEEKSILSVMWKINNTWTSTTSSMSGKTAFTTEQ